MAKLGVNIDHIATLRQLRFSKFPDIVLAAQMCEASGADSIVVHLREDRRHIQDRDVLSLRSHVKTRLNLEMSVAPEIVKIACKIKPDQSTLVPEKRQELTTEGGLNVIKMARKLDAAIRLLRKCRIPVSIFIEPDGSQIARARDLGIDIIELHTGRYANSKNRKEFENNLLKLKNAALYAQQLGLTVNVGHGLDYDNVCAVKAIDGLNEFNIGYSIVCCSVFAGLKNAVAEMKKLVA